MKTIKDYLIEGGYYHFTQYERLYADCIACFGQPDSVQLQMVSTAVKEKCPKPSIHPDALISEILNPMGLITGDELVAWLGGDYSMFKPQGYADILNPPVPDLGEMREISWNEARYQIRSITGIHPLSLNQDDSVYRLIDPEMILPVAKANPMNNKAYVADERDCDDFVKGTLGWLSRWGYGNLLFGRSDVALMNNGVEGIPHVIHHILDTNNQLWMYEPQVKTFIWRYGDIPPISNCDGIKFLGILI